MAQQRPDGKAAVPVNKLQQTTPFLCDIKFDVQLPGVGTLRLCPSNSVCDLSAACGSQLCCVSELMVRVQVPCDPKLLVKPVTNEQLASFWLTSLEKYPRKDIFFEPDNGIPLNLLDLEKYEIPENPPPLAPEDEALLAVKPWLLLCHDASCSQRMPNA